MKKTAYNILLVFSLGISMPTYGNSLSTLSINGIAKSEIDHRGIEQVLRTLEKDHGYDYVALCNQFKAGTMIIEEAESGCQVTFTDTTAEDGIAVIILDIF